MIIRNDASSLYSLIYKTEDRRPKYVKFKF